MKELIPWLFVGYAAVFVVTVTAMVGTTKFVQTWYGLISLAGVAASFVGMAAAWIYGNLWVSAFSMFLIAIVMVAKHTAPDEITRGR